MTCHKGFPRGGWLGTSLGAAAPGTLPRATRPHCSRTQLPGSHSQHLHFFEGILWLANHVLLYLVEAENVGNNAFVYESTNHCGSWCVNTPAPLPQNHMGYISWNSPGRFSPSWLATVVAGFVTHTPFNECHHWPVSFLHPLLWCLGSPPKSISCP